MINIQYRQGGVLFFMGHGGYEGFCKILGGYFTKLFLEILAATKPFYEILMGLKIFLKIWGDTN